MRSPRNFARRTGGGFSPLFLPFRGSRFINGKKIHLHPYAHKGKKEKASFFLFFVLFSEILRLASLAQDDRKGKRRSAEMTRWAGSYFFVLVIP